MSGSPRRRRASTGAAAKKLALDDGVGTFEGSRLLLVADDEVGEGIRAALAAISVDVVWYRSIRELDEFACRDALAFVWSAIGTERGFGRQIGQLQSLASIPVYALVSDGASIRTERGMYTAGVAGVFAWPREGILLARYLAEMLSLRMVRGRARGADSALARVVRAHLRHLPMAGPALDIVVESGHVRLSGQVERLSERDEIEYHISVVPGVAGIDVSEVVVLPPPTLDAEIRRSCRRVIEAEVPNRTVSASVRSGHVRFEGVVSDRRVEHRLRDLAGTIQGVRSVEFALEISSTDVRRAANAQRRLQGLIEALYSGNDARLVFHGGVAVLEGSVTSLKVKRSIERTVSQESVVERVVNKLIVES